MNVAPKYSRNSLVCSVISRVGETIRARDSASAPRAAGRGAGRTPPLLPEPGLSQADHVLALERRWITAPGSGVGWVQPSSATAVLSSAPTPSRRKERSVTGTGVREGDFLHSEAFYARTRLLALRGLRKARSAAHVVLVRPGSRRGRRRERKRVDAGWRSGRGARARSRAARVRRNFVRKRRAARQDAEVAVFELHGHRAPASSLLRAAA